MLWKLPEELWLSSLLKACLAISLLSLALTPATMAKTAEKSGPALGFVSVSPYRVTVDGKGWRPRRPLAIALQAGPWVAGLELKTTVRGTFRVGVTKVDVCGGVRFEAKDFRGHRVVLHGPRLMCPTRANPPAPFLRVLHGLLVKPRVVRLMSPAHPSSVVLRVGDELDLLEPGPQQPFYRPKADPSHLFLIDSFSPSSCTSGSGCPPNFVWRWIATKTGEAFIGLPAACRQSQPPCAVPDLLIRVRIVPARSPVPSRD